MERTISGFRWTVVLALVLLCGARPAGADGWSEKLEVHGFARSTLAFNSPSFDVGDAIQLDSLRTELNLEASLAMYESDALNVSLFTVLRPSYDAVYDLYPDVYGKRARGGDFGTETGGGTAAGLSIPNGALSGDSRPGLGAGIPGQFRYVNGDIARILTGENNPNVVIDPVVFFGSRVAPATPRSRRVEAFGSAPNLSVFDTALQTLLELGVSPMNANFVNLQASLNMAGGGLGANPALREGVLATPVRSPARIAAGLPALGDRGSFRQAPFGTNDRESALATDCFDNAHPYCFLRELYFDVEYEDTLVRIGKQQIVWGKADSFRLQDIVNPLDLSRQSIFIPLEDQRIPTLAIDVIQSIGDVGPLKDVSLELVWVLDRFLPIQVGQCGDPRAFAAACEGRADASAHSAIGLTLAEIEERDWQLRNTEPGFRLEFLVPKPEISFSITGFLGFQDQGVVRLENRYSVANPNPSALLLLQALGAANGLPMAAVPAFDPFDAASTQVAGATLAATYSALVGAVCGSFMGSGDVEGLRQCISGNNAGLMGVLPAGFQLNQLLLPLAGGEFTLEYPRVFTLGASADYQIPNADGVLRFELAYDFDRKIQDTGEEDLIDSSDVVSALIGLDLNPFISFLNPNRTSFLSGQLFVQHILQYDDDGQGRRFIPDETSLIATLFMQNFFRNDGVILTTFAAYDVGAQAFAFGPSLKWILSERVFLELGANIVSGRRQTRPLRNLCTGGDLSIACLSDPTDPSYQAGNFQALNRGFARTAETPFLETRSFGDRFAENRDEIFVSLTYQF